LKCNKIIRKLLGANDSCYLLIDLRAINNFEDEGHPDIEV
jgi:hypothetical protein